MFKKMVPITKQQHAKKRVLPVNSFKFASNSYLVSVIGSEFNKVATLYPIVFVKDGDELRPFALLGLKQGQNLFVDKEGRWNAHYIPAIIRRYPFVLGRNEGNNELMICIDEESEFVSETQGEPLFDEQGNPAPIIEKARNYLIELQRFSELTNMFSKAMSERELLAPLKMQIKNAQGGMVNIDGVFAINETKLNELPDEVFIELRKRGALPLIYAHLLSLIQMERLVQMNA